MAGSGAELLSWLQSTEGRLEVKLGVATLGAILCGLIWWRARRGSPSRAVGALLALTTLVSVAAYFEFGALRYERYMNPHDVYHYYLGSKYSAEHQYTGLYRASLVADAELNAERGQMAAFRESSIRDLHNHRYESVNDVMADADTIRAWFSPNRWTEFKQDVRFFQDAVTPYSKTKWSDMLRDKGYNATPVWNAVARAISSRAPTSDERAMRTLPMLDLALLVGMFGLVWRAFGRTPTVMALLFYGVDYMMAYPHIKGGFLRLDWLVCTVAAGALLKLGRPVLAGAALAYAGLTRVFPLVFALGPAVLLAENLLSVARARLAPDRPPVRRDLLVFFAALAVTASALIGASILADGGTSLWSVFLDKISLHNSDMSSNRAGNKYVFYGLMTGLRYDDPAVFERHAVAYGALSLAGLIPSIAVMRRARPWEALYLGFVPVFFLTAPTFYYYVMLVVPFLYLADRLDRGWRAAGAASLFAVSMLAYAFDLEVPQGYGLFFAVSVAMLGACVLLWGVAWRTSEPAEPAAPGGWARWEWLVVAGGVGLLSALMLSAPAPERADAVKVVERTVPGEGEISLGFVGDVMLSRRVEEAVRASGKEWDSLFDEVRELLSEPDLTLANLETPVSRRGKVIDKRFTFRSPPESLPSLVRSGIDVVSLANNHTLDYGPEALEDTEQLVGAAGLGFGGITRVGVPQVPLIREVRGLKVGVLFYCDPVPRYSCAEEFEVYERRPAEATREVVERDLEALRPQVDLVLVLIHWGVEYDAEPRKQTRQLARAMVDLGADVVAGAHPHVQHPIERYKDGVILYSLGNFVFDQRTRPATRVSRLVRVVAGRDGVRDVQIVPMEIDQERYFPRPLLEGFLDLSQDSVSLRSWPTPPLVAR